ncbi:MAG TPA: LLM class flavin-dependent oxidoreductase [Chloroflexota bacterium]|nr:LLM class flavin-dependent oxidoreductase [Chloroflexota bacterium]
MARSVQRPAPRFDWFVPIDGDGAHIGTVRAEREPTFEYLREVVQTAEEQGYYSLLIPTRFANGLFDEHAPLAETWTTATALLAVTNRIRLLIAVRPGFISTGLFAQMAATLDQLSHGRADINVVPGGIAGDFERLGEVSDHAYRYARAEEFIMACRALWAKPEPVVFAGQHITLNGALVSPSPSGEGLQMYLGGASDSALALAGRQADVYLAWIQPLEAMAALLARARQHYAAAGRAPRFGLRTHLVVRDSEEAAWAAADDLLSEAAGTVKAQRQAVFAGTPMVGQQAQARAYADHRVGRHLWNGISTVRVNCGTAIVGTPQQVATELLAYWRLGIDEFIVSGYPHVEECRHIATDVLPLLAQSIERERVALA